MSDEDLTPTGQAFSDVADTFEEVGYLLEGGEVEEAGRLLRRDAEALRKGVLP